MKKKNEKIQSPKHQHNVPGFPEYGAPGGTVRGRVAKNETQGISWNDVRSLRLRAHNWDDAAFPLTFPLDQGHTGVSAAQKRHHASSTAWNTLGLTKFRISHGDVVKRVRKFLYLKYNHGI